VIDSQTPSSSIVALVFLVVLVSMVGVVDMGRDVMAEDEPRHYCDLLVAQGKQVVGTPEAEVDGLTVQVWDKVCKCLLVQSGQHVMV